MWCPTVWYSVPPSGAHKTRGSSLWPFCVPYTPRQKQHNHPTCLCLPWTWVGQLVQKGWWCHLEVNKTFFKALFSTDSVLLLVLELVLGITKKNLWFLNLCCCYMYLPSIRLPKWRTCRNSLSLIKPFRGVAHPSASTWTHWRSNWWKKKHNLDDSIFFSRKNNNNNYNDLQYNQELYWI